ncbi:MAG: bifunctional diaminohydroxyphosphoribosylaminopyrimidine deaminase/5-amino-6-(5-phosphoribosylamino)uracil reductase RibD [Burkholderiaceae bacterium]
MFSQTDHDFMSRAIELAARGLYTTTPNPRVGCVLVNEGKIVGEGWHEQYGGPHAEVNALQAAGTRAKGATAYVTLEPCSHHGRTPPCVEALIAARVACVIAAMEDPNPRVSGAGFARLRDAGIEVRCGLLYAQAYELNPGFISRMVLGRPWVRLKCAVSLDAMSALPDGTSQWITGEAARIDGHHYRARACAILTGYGTVRDDNPQLNIRLVQSERQPLVVIVDSRLETPLDAKVLNNSRVLVVCSALQPEKVQALHERGAEVIALANSDAKVDLSSLMTELGRRQINEVHVEAGFKLNGSLIREACVDELLLYQAPCLLGQASGFANLTAVPALNQRHQLRFVGAELVGDDLRVVARFADPDHGLAQGNGPHAVRVSTQS